MLVECASCRQLSSTCFPYAHERDCYLQLVLMFVLGISSRAVAEYLSDGLDHRFDVDDVIMTSGCSQAIQHCLDVLRFDGCNFLIPRPGFPVYETLCSYYGVECRHYDLLQDRSWEVDLVQVSKLADNNTAAIIICNPGNPCGTVFEYDHLSQVRVIVSSCLCPYFLPLFIPVNHRISLQVEENVLKRMQDTPVL